MKVSYTKTLAKKVLLAFLVFSIFFSLTSLFIRHFIIQKVENVSKLANNIDHNQSKPNEALLLVHRAEDDFQASLVNTSDNKYNDYKAKLSQAFKTIDILLKAEADTSRLTSAQNSKVKFWYRKKIKLSDKLYILKRDFDSLLNVYAISKKDANEDVKVFSTNVHSKEKIKDNTDTVKQKIVIGEKKGLFGRIKDAIVNKNNNSASKYLIEINHQKKINTIDLATKRILTEDKKTYTKKLQQLQQHNIKLLNAQRDMVAMNTHISNELESIISDVRTINYSMSNELKKAALKNYQETSSLLDRFCIVAFSLVMIFAILLIIFIFQLNKSEVLLRRENERSVTMAQQKMDLLLHMSHEVRNPLTSINGLLFILGKSNLSQRQVEMLDSIKLSSEMLLRTLNDTLDTAKMENSDFKINNDPFNPDLVLKAAIEGMKFSGAKKELTIAYNFKGDKETILLGDGFRLEQIMVNLLSNAIKYTDKGGITVNAELSTDGILYVDIVDTGVGISPDQQPKLFSKYYQTNSSNGKVGTGLGLFICKKLVDLQKGKISVKSIQAEGTTFSFFIPYQHSNNNSSLKQGINNPLQLLSEISILAVDDNEINLMFLKKMMEKWDVIFHQASDGKQALDIISKNKIAIVITDIGMPEMDGNELLKVIKKLDKYLPVIVMSGSAERVNAEKFLKAGFSGVIGKPFIESDLIDQLVKVLK